jgi:zona occludens toxin (predicted ATPase)
MSIYLITGVPGAGKTYSCIKDHILEALTPSPSDPRIRKVFHNIRGLDPLKVSIHLGLKYTLVKKALVFLGESVKEATKYLDIKNLSEYDRKQLNGSFVVLDEAHRYFNPQDFRSLEKYKELISLHRHYNIDFCLMTQNHADLWQGIKSRVELTYFLSKDPLLGSFGFYRENIHEEVRINGTPLITKRKRYDKKIFDLYQSRQVVDFDELNKKPNPLLQKKVLIPLLFASSFVVWSFSRLGNLSTFGGSNIQTNSTNKNSSIVVLSSSSISHNSKLDFLKSIQGDMIGYKSYSCSGSMCKFVLSDGSIEVLPRIYLNTSSSDLKPRLTPIYEVEEK